MEFSTISSTVLWACLLFVCWSGLLALLTSAIKKLNPAVTQWSKFWFVWLLLALVPLMPVTFEHQLPLIPDILRQPIAAPANSLFLDTHAMLSQGESFDSFDFLIGLLMVTLLLGCFIGVSQFVISIIRTTRIIKRGALLKDVSQLSSRHQSLLAEKNIEVRITEQAMSPLVYGFFKTTLLLPESVFVMPERQCYLLIEHELTHVKRHDPKLVLIFRFIAGLFWFNPFLQIFEKRFLQSMEMNCDSEVIRAYPKLKLEYAQALLASLKFSKNSTENRLMAYFSGPGFQKQDFEIRIRQAMGKSTPVNYGMGYRFSLFLLFSFIGFTAIAAKPHTPAQTINIASETSFVPVSDGYISSGYEDISAFRGNRPHKALDFAAATGTEVVASFSGTVLIADDSTLHQNYGKVVLIEHKEQLQSLYAHLDTINVKAGQFISAGSKLGTVGSTGRTTGPHLHFEVLKEGKRANPNHYLNLTKN